MGDEGSDEVTFVDQRTLPVSAFNAAIHLKLAMHEQDIPTVLTNGHPVLSAVQLCFGADSEISKEIQQIIQQALIEQQMSKTRRSNAREASH